MFAAAALLADDRELIAVATLAGLAEGFNVKQIAGRTHIPQ